MKHRISSWFTRFMIMVTAAAFVDGRCASGEDAPGYYTHPDTGIVYRKVVRTVERPVVETKVEKKEQTVFRPETVTEKVPETQTVFTPVTEHAWQPVLHGRWNPFRQPVVTYHHVPVTSWKQKSNVVTRSQTRTNWVAEKRMVDVPQRIVSIKREEKIDFEPVGRVAPPAQATPPGVSEQIASRLRPLAANTRIQPLGQGGNYASGWQSRNSNLATNQLGGSSYGASFGNTPYGSVANRSMANFPSTSPRVASSLGRMTSDPPRRNAEQGGLRATDLYPRTQYSQSLPPVSGGTGVASLPMMRFLR
ncbi:hypothetical protein [Planctomycetes bacterium K23_9]|uniref:Uncharacterized protein n=1 Tax=Stieleria marina TaxID=1930275 RepID=A0A517P2C2_9BACT|nr:hypothetical protein K239x_55460 [Planctomycetes bacterium K23_9]